MFSEQNYGYLVIIFSFIIFLSYIMINKHKFERVYQLIF
jgi:hypothetical protein